MGEERREVLEALSDKTRYDILMALSRKPLTGDEIAEAVERSRSTVEAHLSKLLRLELVTRRREEKKYFYEITPLAKTWMDKLEPGNEPKVPPQAVKTHTLRSFRWLYSAILAGVIYTMINLVVPFNLVIFSLLLGVIYSWISATTKEMLESLLVTAVTLGALSPIAAFGSFSISGWVLFFIVSLILLALFGFPAWLVTKKAKSFFRV